MSSAEKVSFEPLVIQNVRNQLKVYSEKVDQAVQLAEDIFVVDEKSAKTAMDFALEARKMQKSIEAKKLEITGPSRSFVSEINSIAKSYSVRLEDVADIILGKIQAWKSDQNVISEGNSETLFCEELGESFDVMFAPDISKIRSNSGIAYERSVWKYEVLDYREVPIDYIEVNDSSVKLAIRNGERNIPGLRIYKETKTSLRSK